MIRKNFWIGFIFILLIIGSGVFVSLPTTKKFLGKDVSLHEGLDLQGGVQLKYEIDLSKTADSDRAQAIESTRKVIERRVNTTGVAEPLIQPTKVGGKDAIIVELPGIKDVNDAISLIGKTAQLDFRELDPNSTTTEPKWIPTGLSGKQLSKASVTFEQNTNSPQISLQFNSDGQKLFGDITARNINKQVAIFLDDQVLSAPTVQEAIPSGQAVINGQFTIADARQITNLLNAGALDVPIKLVEQRTVGATLGEDSVKRSLVAGVVGLFLVIVFMVINYRLAGAVAVLALLAYSAITLGLFKFVPVTLTLAGIAGFILSIGMAVDANILIFERMREELRTGSDIKVALEEGFKRAWPSVRDSNVATLITCGILFFSTTGLVRGFALTLAIGVFVSLFSSVTTSRSLLRIVANIRIGERFLQKI